MAIDASEVLGSAQLAGLFESAHAPTRGSAHAPTRRGCMHPRYSEGDSAAVLRHAERCADADVVEHREVARRDLTVLLVGEADL